MPAVTAIGVGKLACCQPLAVSLVKVAVPSLVPVPVHSVPTWVPVETEGL